MASTVPAAKAALVTAWDAATTSPVIVGPVVGVGVDGCVTVGVQNDFSPAAVDGFLVREGYDARRREQYTINCAVAYQTGSTGIAASEAAAFALWDTLAAVLDANPTLTGLVLKAGVLDRYQLTESQAGDGLTVTLAFAVAIDAFTT